MGSVPRTEQDHTLPATHLHQQIVHHLYREKERKEGKSGVVSCMRLNLLRKEEEKDQSEWRG